MSMQDPIADLLTRVRNAQSARHADVEMPHSQLKEAICKVLEQEGYVVGFQVAGTGKRTLKLQLKYHAGVPVIDELRRVSRPGLRVYKGAGELPLVRGGLGVAVISTNQGVMADRQARAKRVGGEVLCTVF